MRWKADMDRLPPDLSLQGLPSWITPDLIAETIGAWQPYYAQRLTPEDAVDILLGVGSVFAVVSGGSRHGTVRRLGKDRRTLP